MAAIRIIPCLDVKDGKVVKGVHFENLVEAGTLEHLSEVVKEGGASAVLLASLLHFRKYTIAQIKDYFRRQNIEVR